MNETTITLLGLLYCIGFIRAASAIRQEPMTTALAQTFLWPVYFAVGLAFRVYDWATVR